MAVFGVHRKDNIKELDQALTALLEEPQEEPEQETTVRALESDPERKVYWTTNQDDEPGAFIYVSTLTSKLKRLTWATN